MEFKIGHVSDLHIWRMKDVRIRDFLSKRIVGAANLLMHRNSSHSPAVARKALGRLEELNVDHVCISGDLTNLALPSEFEAALEVVSEIPDSHRRVSIIPGNHDYYTPDAVARRLFETTFEPWLKSDLPSYQLASGYPVCHLRGNVAIISMNSGIASMPMMAIGRVQEDELRATAALLDDPLVRSRFKVVMIHHPLLPTAHVRVQALRHLVNADEVVSVLRHGAVDLAIHGHNHHVSTTTLPHLRGTGTMWICEAGSTSYSSPADPHFAGSFNVFTIEDKHLSKIETHLYDGFENAFVHWREETYERVLDE
jgi:3',5'-cyclic AMP phosphodiesterase CpdA